MTIAGSCESYLAVDLGGGSGRVIRGSFDGSQMSVAEVHRFSNSPVEVSGHWYWDIRRLFASVREGLGCGMAGSPSPASVGITSWGVDFALLDENGALLSDPYSYRDPQCKAGFDAVLAAMDWDELFAATGVQAIEVNTLFQLAAVLHSRPGLIRSARRLLMIASLIDSWLTGRQVIEHSLATTSQCLDVTTRTWSTRVLGRAGLPLEMFPEVVQPGAASDPLLPRRARELGASSQLEVIVTMQHDTGASVTALPIKSPLAAFVSTGTWIMVGAEVAAPVLSHRCRDLNFTNEAGTGGTFQLLKNLTGMWLLEECRRHWRSRGIACEYADLAAGVRAAAPFSAVFDPEWGDLVTPDDPSGTAAGMPDRIIRHCRGRSVPGAAETGALTRIILESIALSIRRALDWLAELRSVHADSVHICGGAVADPLFCQMIADAAGLPVLAGPGEATAWGNICVQAITRGRVADLAQARELIAASVPIISYEPNTTIRDRWDEQYQNFLDAAATSTYGIRPS
jgi:rhamnulokinase